MTVAAQSLGIAIGCIIGLVPLLFLDQKEKALRASFDDVDLSGDGFLDKYEIAMALHRFGVMLSEKAPVSCTWTFFSEFCPVRVGPGRAVSPI